MKIKEALNNKVKKGIITASLITLGIGVPSFASTGVPHSPDLNNNKKTVGDYSTNFKGVAYEIQETLNKFMDLGRTDKIIENIESKTLPYVKNLQIKINNYLNAIKKGEITVKQARDMLHKASYFQHVQKNLKLLIEIVHYLNEKTNKIINYGLEHKKDFKITEQELDIIRHEKNKIMNYHH